MEPPSTASTHPQASYGVASAVRLQWALAQNTMVRCPTCMETQPYPLRHVCIFQGIHLASSITASLVVFRYIYTFCTAACTNTHFDTSSSVQTHGIRLHHRRLHASLQEGRKCRFIMHMFKQIAVAGSMHRALGCVPITHEYPILKTPYWMQSKHTNETGNREVHEVGMHFLVSVRLVYTIRERDR